MIPTEPPCAACGALTLWRTHFACRVETRLDAQYIANDLPATSRYTTITSNFFRSISINSAPCTGSASANSTNASK